MKEPFQRFFEIIDYESFIDSAFSNAEFLTLALLQKKGNKCLFVPFFCASLYLVIQLDIFKYGIQN